MATTALEQQQLEQLLGIPSGPAPKRRRWMYAAGALAVLAAGAWRLTSAQKPPQFTTAPVRRQTISKTISATGALQAVTTVQVGTQVSGTISELDADFNSQVHKGQVIARLEPSQFQAQLAQANASWMSAQASRQAAQNNVAAADAAVLAAQANADHADAALKDAQASADRTRKLVDAGVGPAMDLQTSQAALSEAAAQKQQAVAQITQAKAQAQASRSQVSQAEAQTAQAKAAVDVAQVNLTNSVIKAPIDGVVVARNVDIGQTVAASLQAPVIFLIANDLTRMQVLANIDEADVGQLQTGAPVSFTVDAYPSDVFRGAISQIRLAPTTVQNVVTYTAVIDVANPDLKLKPGMTANVTVSVARKENVLAVPNAALRFHPDAAATPRRSDAGPVVYKVQSGVLASVPVQTGMTDGVRTEIVSGAIQEGDVVATGSTGAATPARPAGAPAARSPFAGGRGGRS